MAPLERFVFKDQGNEKIKKPVEGKVFLSTVDPKRQEEIKDMLGQFRENYRKRRADKIREARQRARLQTKSSEFLADSPLEKKERREKNDLSAVNDYSRIWDFQYNRDSYEKKNGWKERYLTENDPEDGVDLKEKMSIEQFVYKQQVEQLQIMRENLMVERLDHSMDVLYPQLSQPETQPQQREDKLSALATASKEYMLQQRAQIDKYLAAPVSERAQLKDVMLAQFRAQVFADLDFSNEVVLKETNSLFDQLIEDYEDMQNAVFQLSALNDKMVALLADPNLDEEKWLAELAKESEEELAKIKEEQAASQGERGYYDFNGFEVNYGQITFNYSEPIKATEKLAPDTNISIKMLSPGRFNVTFPTMGEVKMESVFRVGQRVNDQGVAEIVYLFEDPLQDKPRMVTEKQFKAMINGVYLEHIMSDSVKQGIDYRGPNLNDEVLRDDQMFNLAKLLFQPRNIENNVMTGEQAESFRKLLMILAGKANNQAGEGDYGDLLAARSRVGLLMLSLENPQNAQKCYNYLKKYSWDQLKAVSVESLCRSIGIPKNSGNFRK